MYFLIIAALIIIGIIFLLNHSKRTSLNNHFENNITDEEYQIKKTRLIELNEILICYSDKINETWKNSENEKVKEYFLEVSFELNRLLYEIDIDIESNIYTDKMIERCYKFSAFLKEIFDNEKQ